MYIKIVRDNLSKMRSNFVHCNKKKVKMLFNMVKFGEPAKQTRSKKSTLQGSFKP